MEEIRGITWDLWGSHLSDEQTIQRLLIAGFPVQQGVVLHMYAIAQGESSAYQRAWHINVKRNDDGTIVRDGNDAMTATSIDLGFMQINVPISPTQVRMTSAAASDFVQSQFDNHPQLADPWESSRIAYDMWKRRGYQPWYAYKPGTPQWRRRMKDAALALGNWAAHSWVGSDPDTGKQLTMTYKATA